MRWRETKECTRNKRNTNYKGRSMDAISGGNMFNSVQFWVIVGMGVLALLLLLSFLANLYRKAGPNEAIVAYGLGGTRVVKGHGTLVVPMVQNWRQLSLELMLFEVAPQQD